MFKLKTRHEVVIPTNFKGHPNQCAAVMHHTYRCTVTVYTEDTLNERGFVIDHKEIREAIEYGFQNFLKSCEVIAMSIDYKVRDVLHQAGVKYYRIHTEIEPLDGNFSSTTYIKTYA